MRAIMDRSLLHVPTTCATSSAIRNGQTEKKKNFVSFFDNRGATAHTKTKKFRSVAHVTHIY